MDDPQGFHVTIKGLVFDERGAVLLLRERSGTSIFPVDGQPEKARVWHAIPSLLGVQLAISRTAATRLWKLWRRSSRSAADILGSKRAPSRQIFWSDSTSGQKPTARPAR